MSIRVKVLIPMVAVAVVCALAIGALGVFIIRSFVSDFGKEQLLNAHMLAASILEQHHADAERASALSASNELLVESLQEYFKSDNRDPIVQASISMLNATGVDFLTVMDTQGNVIVRAHEPDNFGDSLANQANIKSAMAGKQYTTTEAGTAVKLSVRSGTPIFDPSGTLIGVVSLGFRLDQSGFVDYVKGMSGTEVTVFLNDTRVSTTIFDDKGERAVGTTASETISAQVLAGGDYIGRAVVIGKPLSVYYSPVRDAENKILGMLFVGLDTSQTDARTVRDTWIMAVIALFLCLVSAGVALKISGKIAGPIREMSGAAERLAVGDIDVEIGVKTAENTKDEIVFLANSFTHMIHSNRERADLISNIAGGDLGGEITPSSEKDVVGIALHELLDKNNQAFSSMKDAALQLDTASSQIAGGAQTLSHGAVEQAATIERLHMELKELSGRTMAKSEQAKQAAEMSESIKASAEKGSRQMDQMMDAVSQISKASEDIGKVIKVIDDIAFQTNILALNAAVEAARAGQHGKGFAVVAEEVRNLAAKSAAAAKDTGILIANSIEKAKLGAQISADTLTSFTEIVSGINESSIIIDEIAGFMQTQNSEIGEITHGVNEISNMVQSVSATAEQSAASSEEMSAQAASMSATLSGYKLRERQGRISGQARPALPESDFRI